MGEKDLLKNTIEEEQAQVLNVVRRLGPKLSGLMFVFGILVFGISVYVLVVPPDPTLTVRLSIILTGALGFIGALNIMCGLLLLLGED